MNLIGGSVAQQKNPIQLRQLGPEVHVSLERDLYPAVHFLDRLRRGILDLAFIQRKELGVGGGMTGKGEGKTAGSRREYGLGRGRERLRQKAVEAIKERLPGRVGWALLSRNLQRKGQVGLTRNADLAADQPIDMGRKRGGGG